MENDSNTAPFFNETRGLVNSTQSFVTSTNVTYQVSTESQFDPADDAIWILTSTFIIFTMQSGFGLLESGTVSNKNEVNIMVKNAVDVIFGGLTYWAFGYAFSFGQPGHPYSNAFCGWGRFFVNAEGDDIGEVYSKFFFQASFATTATTIVSATASFTIDTVDDNGGHGAMAERTRLESYIIFSLVNTLVYCFPSHWVWARNGWLYKLGTVDIAGAGPVHLVGGVTGLVATLMLKPRYGRFRSKRPPPMASPTNAVLGMFMLWWGWLGFNCGSTFGISGGKWKLAARSAVATLNASMAGGIVGMFLSYVFKNRKCDVSYVINGILGALVGITAYCALAKPWEGLVIGAVGALVSLGGVELLNKLKVDDPVGCVGVHAIGASWSLISVGLFARRDSLWDWTDIDHNYIGLFYGDWYLLGVQVLTVVVITLWTAVSSFILLKIIDMIIGMRVSLQHEILGADLVEHAVGPMKYDKKRNKVRRRNITCSDVTEVNNSTHNERRARKYAESVKHVKDLKLLEENNNRISSQTNGHVTPVSNGTTNKMMWRLAVTNIMTENTEKRKGKNQLLSIVQKQRQKMSRKTSRSYVNKRKKRKPEVSGMSDSSSSFRENSGSDGNVDKEIAAISGVLTDVEPFTHSGYNNAGYVEDSSADAYPITEHTETGQYQEIDDDQEMECDGYLVNEKVNIHTFITYI